MLKSVLVVAGDAGRMVEDLIDGLESRGVEALTAFPEEAHACRLDEFDAIAVVGDPRRGSSREREGSALHDVMQLVTGAVLQHMPVVTMGAAVTVAAQGSLLVGREVACPPDEAVAAEVRKHHGIPIEVDVVETENGIITAAGPEATAEVVQLLCERLLGRREDAVEHPLGE